MDDRSRTEALIRFTGKPSALRRLHAGVRNNPPIIAPFMASNPIRRGSSRVLVPNPIPSVRFPRHV